MVRYYYFEIYNFHIQREVDDDDDGDCGFDGYDIDPRDNVQGLAYNKGRGGGYLFGADVTEHFLKKNKLQMIIRSHEVQMTG